MVSGAVIAGIGATEGLFPHAFDEWFGLSGNWALLVGGFALIITLIVNPEGIAGTGWKKQQQKKRTARRAGAARARRPAALGLRRPAAARRGGEWRSRDGRPARRPASPCRFGGVRALVDVDLEVARGPARRADRPERRGQDDLHRRDLGLRSLPGTGRARRTDISTGSRRTRAHGAGWRGRGSRSSCSTTSPCARTSRSRPTGRRCGRRSKEVLSRPVDDDGGRRCGARAARARRDGGRDADRAHPGAAQARRRRAGARGRAPAALPRRAGGGSRHAREQGARPPPAEVVDAGTAMLLVDHDMGLVLGISDYVVVLEFGKVIAHGPPDVVRRDPQVIEAYLGERGGRARARRSRRHDDRAPCSSIEGLTAGYDQAAVIRDLDLTVGAGEVVALLGANGAGKTTTLRVISGLVHPMHGPCRLRRRGPGRASRPTQRARLGIAHVPEGRGHLLRPDRRRALPARPPRRAPGRGGRVRVLPRSRELRTRRIGLLSGGEQQMLAVGRALARQPRLLLLDELCLGLAPVIVERLLPVVRAVRAATRAAASSSSSSTSTSRSRSPTAATSSRTARSCSTTRRGAPRRPPAPDRELPRRAAGSREPSCGA